MMHDFKTNMLGGMVDKLASQAVVSEEDRAALLQLPYALRTIEPGRYLLREGDLTEICTVLISGFAYRHKTSSNGGRQIVGMLFPGDLINIQQLYIDVADHSIQTLVKCEIATIPLEYLRALIRDRAPMGEIITTSILIEGSIMREWLLNLGQRDARSRVAYFLCEFIARVDRQGEISGNTYHLPMTQEQLGDALGLTAVHINRTLKVLEEEGLIKRNKNLLSFPRPNELRDISSFSSRYLHIYRQ